jgi:hypothetical protein
MSIEKKSFKLADFVDLSSFAWDEESVTALAEAINNSELGQYYTASWNSSKSRLDIYNKTLRQGLYMTATELGAMYNGGNAVRKACTIATANYSSLYFMLALTEECYAGGFKYVNTEYWRNACEKMGDGYVSVISGADYTFYYNNGNTDNSYHNVTNSPTDTGNSCLICPEFFYGSLSKRIVKVRGYKVPEGGLYTVSGNKYLNLGFGTAYETYAITDGGED